MTDDVLIFRADRKRAVVMLFASAAFASLGAFSILEGDKFGWVVLCFFGLGVTASLWMLRPNGMYLRLDKDGFEVPSLFGKMKRKWTEVDSFYVGSIRMSKMIGISYSQTYKKNAILHTITSAVSGMEGALPDSFEKSPEEICTHLNIWKQRYGSPNRPVEGTR